jgi:serine/threonine protein kinase
MTGPVEPSALIGRIFDGRYRVEALIGQGGMAVVYRAIQLSRRTDVALKIISNADVTDERLVARFNQEVMATSRLRHPHTVDVVDYGQSQDGHLFLVMELLRGRTLAEAIRREAPFDPARACRVIRQICGSLAEAHGSGIVHRDLKPDNVFLTDGYEEPDYVKVLDFGIAKFIASGASNETLTKTGFICGTPLYLSPEQGLDQTVDHRTDLYSLGVMLFELMVGTPPFRADSPIGVVMRHIHDAAPDVRSMPGCRGIPAPVAELVASLLEKSPGDRPSSAAEVAERIDAAGVLRGDPLPRIETEAPIDVLTPIGEEPDRTRLLPPMGAAMGGVKVERMPSSERPTLYIPRGVLPEPDPPEPDLDIDHGGMTQIIALSPKVQRQLAGLKKAARPGSTRRRLGPRQVALALLVIGAIALAAAWWGLGSAPVPDSRTGARGMPAPPPSIQAAPSAAAVPATSVVYTVTSHPPGAEVRDMAGRRLGVTPYAAVLPAEREELAFEVRSEGHRPETVLVTPKTAGAGRTVFVRLEPLGDKDRALTGASNP